MNIVLSVLSVLAGLIVGSFINIQLLNLGTKLIPSPIEEGANSIDVLPTCVENDTTTSKRLT